MPEAIKSKLFLRITKVDAVKREVSGTMTEEVTDKSLEKMDYATSKPYFEKWSTGIAKATEGKSLGNVRAMHSSVAAGKVVEINFDDVAKRIDITAKIVDDAEWLKCAEGVYTGFSIGGNYVGKRWDDPAEPSVKRYTVDPVEVSIVDNPCLGTAHFTAVKADGTTEQRTLKGWQPTIDEVATEATALAKVSGKAFADHMEEARTKLIAAKAADAGADSATKPANIPGVVAPGNDIDEETPQEEAASSGADGALTLGNTKPALVGDPASEPDKAAQIDWNINQVFRCEVDGKVFATKAEAKQHVEALKVLEQNGSPLAKALAEAAAKASGKKPAGDYGDVKYADPGLQADKKPRYPIDTPAHIRAAWSYINKAKNQSAYTPEQVDKIKAAIVAAWKDKIDTSGPPSAAKMEALDNPQAFDLLKALYDTGVQKGMHTVGWVSHALANMGDILSSVVWEEKWEHDTDSELPQMAMDAFAALRTLLVEMISEETAELIQDLTQDQMTVDIALLEPPCDAVIIQLSAKALEVVKGDAELLAKIGARHSAADAKTIQAVHDHAQELGAKCDAGNCDKTADGPVAKLAEVEIAKAELEKQISDALPRIAEMGDTLAKAMGDLSAAQAEIEKLKAVPAPMPVIVGRVVGKTVDTGGSGVDTEAALNGPMAVKQLIDTIGIDRVRDLLLEASLANPMRMGGAL